MTMGPSGVVERIDRFFGTARERYEIMLLKDAGEPAPWTRDGVFGEWRFCCVHREDDRTTRWFRRNIRDSLFGRRAVEATLVFRWFNRIETAEIIKDLIERPWVLRPGSGSSEEAFLRLEGIHPVVTGAYIIRGEPGTDKLRGVLRYIDRNIAEIRERIPDRLAEDFRWDSLEVGWRALQELTGIGPVTGYEVVSDLRWTPVLQNATDVMTWANPGPGCQRGLGRVVLGRVDGFTSGMRDGMIAWMRDLLAMSQDERHWPKHWKPWEMREVEHWLCEFDKYERARGGTRLKRAYR